MSDDVIYFNFTINLALNQPYFSLMSHQAQLEVMWAMKAYNHAEVYFNVSDGIFRVKLLKSLACPSLLTIHLFTLQLISSVDPKFLKLTKSDDQIYTKFREVFPDLKIQVLDPELLKSAEAKEVCQVPPYIILKTTDTQQLKLMLIVFTEMEAFL